MPRYERSLAEIRFGDLFAGEFLFDAYLKADGAALGLHPMGDEMRKRLAKHYGRPEIQGADKAVAYSSLLPQKPDSDALLGHGRPTRALVLNDDCAIETAMGRENARPRGRLLFAAIREASNEEVQALADAPSFDHFALPAEAPWVETAGIVDLGRLFMIASSDVLKLERKVSLSDELSEELAVCWAAYATRHGPMPGLKNAEKLAVLFSRLRRADVDEEERETAGLVSELVNAAWRLEGQALNAVSEAYESGENVESAIQDVQGTVKSLADLAAKASESLDRLVDRAQKKNDTA